MSADEVLACAREAARLGYGTLVMQSGEDPGLERDFITGLVRSIKRETGLAVTLSLGERDEADLVAWREAGADRYLLRFETSDRALFDFIHPPVPGQHVDRFELLRRLPALGYEAGSGVMIGIPGQTYDSLADDLVLFRALDLDMIGVGPFLPHPATPLGAGAALRQLPQREQVPNDEQTTLKVLALARILCPDANIPSTTALGTLNKEQGRALGLQRGANVVMPNLTPLQYRRLYEIYPEKACLNESADIGHERIVASLRSIGRAPGRGQGGRGSKGARV